MSKKPIHTVPHGDRWANRREGSQRVSETFDTQAAAADAARTTAQREHAEHLIHGRNRSIREHRDGYGNDPYPPKG